MNTENLHDLRNPLSLSQKHFCFAELRDDLLWTILLPRHGLPPLKNGQIITLTLDRFLGGRSLSQNAPNPFNPTTRIQFALPEAGNVHLTIHNTAGQVVRVLADGYNVAGRQSVVWDGRDESGHEVASGVYFYRLATSTNTMTRRMVLVR